MSNGFEIRFLFSQTTCAITKSKACCSSVSAAKTSERRTGKHFDLRSAGRDGYFSGVLSGGSMAVFGGCQAQEPEDLALHGR